MISFSKYVIASPDVLIRQVDGESVLLNLQNERYYGLDDIGTHMWEVLTQTDGTIQDAYEALLAEYDVDAQRLREDLAALLEKLTSQGLLEIVEEKPQ